MDQLPRVMMMTDWLSLVAGCVCVVQDATDEEILEYCNKSHHPGTTNGWALVVHDADRWKGVLGDECSPVQCADHKGRIHYVVMC